VHTSNCLCPKQQPIRKCWCVLNFPIIYCLCALHVSVSKVLFCAFKVPISRQRESGWCLSPMKWLEIPPSVSSIQGVLKLYTSIYIERKKVGVHHAKFMFLEETKINVTKKSNYSLFVSLRSRTYLTFHWLVNPVITRPLVKEECVRYNIVIMPCLFYIRAGLYKKKFFCILPSKSIQVFVKLKYFRNRNNTLGF